MDGAVLSSRGSSVLVDGIVIDDVVPVLPDFEPGASREPLLLTSDSYEDINEEMTVEPAKSDRPCRGTSRPENADSMTAAWNEEEMAKRIGALEIQDCVAMHAENNDVEDVDDDDVNSDEWRNRKKHVFVLSDAGKPIYSRYGNEGKLVTLMGVMQALVSFVQDNKDHIRCISAGKHTFVFNVRGPIILVAVSRGRESVPQLLLQLNYIYSQILSVLTHTQLTKIFEQRRNYDLRRLLSGAEKFFDSILDFMDRDPSLVLGAVRCLQMPSASRDSITQCIIQSCNKVKNLVFAILVANEQLVTFVRMKKYCLHYTDLHLIINLVSASESFKTGESWMPICLPRFDSSVFLHGHVSYLDENSPACLLLFTSDRDMFFTLSEAKRKIVEKLQKCRGLEAINESVLSNGYTTGQLGIPDLRHFMYKAKSIAQFTSPRLEAPYMTEKFQEDLFGLFLHIHHQIHNIARPLKILYYSGQKEAIMGWVTPSFELYVIFEPLVTKIMAIDAINKLLRWIKKEEDQLFILNSPTF